MPHIAFLTSISVIWMAREDLLSAVELFEQHSADEKMRPGHRSQRQNRIGAVKHREIEAFGAADRKGELLRPAFAPPGDAACKGAA